MSEINLNQKEANARILRYNGKPLVRKGDVISYGDAHADKYVLTLEIREKKKSENGVDIASNVLILIQNADVNSKEIVKFGEKNSLYEAFEIGEIWLESYLK